MGGATVRGDTIWIDANLSSIMTKGERRVLLAHEISHWKNKDNLRLVLLTILFLGCRPLINYFKRRMEFRADLYSILKTKDIDSFITLMDKLEHTDTSHPAKEERLQLAETMRGKL